MSFLRADLGWSLGLPFIFNMAAFLGLLKISVDLSDHYLLSSCVLKGVLKMMLEKLINLF